ncbi:hypothetical protein C8E87_0633 [Paractinoplanes brasiliensis]|uniref:Uncharacterized protein n=1 Tax=Paractinoplanes brasiliensis TaxID=52695 RepID=A0A4R6JLM8_9ACTN|nr:hypothetical protein C8E87_0633 [Actinoplanes brasiliensis]
MLSEKRGTPDAPEAVGDELYRQRTYELGIAEDDVYVATGSRNAPQAHGSAAEMLDSAAGRGPGVETLAAPGFVLTALRHFQDALT